MVVTLSSEASDPSLAELIDYSVRASALKQAGRSLMAPGDAGSVNPTDWPANWLPDGDIASIFDASLLSIEDTGNLEGTIISPLRDRDLKVLIDWFTPEGIGDIEVDICHYLQQLMPEPCWEDDPFDFLEEYL